MAAGRSCVQSDPGLRSIRLDGREGENTGCDMSPARPAIMLRTRPRMALADSRSTCTESREMLVPGLGFLLLVPEILCCMEKVGPQVGSCHRDKNRNEPTTLTLGQSPLPGPRTAGGTPLLRWMAIDARGLEGKDGRQLIRLGRKMADDLLVCRHSSAW